MARAQPQDLDLYGEQLRNGPCPGECLSDYCVPAWCSLLTKKRLSGELFTLNPVQRDWALLKPQGGHLTEVQVMVHRSHHLMHISIKASDSQNQSSKKLRTGIWRKSLVITRPWLFSGCRATVPYSALLGPGRSWTEVCEQKPILTCRLITDTCSLRRRVSEEPLLLRGGEFYLVLQNHLKRDKCSKDNWIQKWRSLSKNEMSPLLESECHLITSSCLGLSQRIIRLFPVSMVREASSFCSCCY